MKAEAWDWVPFAERQKQIPTSNDLLSICMSQ